MCQANSSDALQAACEVAASAIRDEVIEEVILMVENGTTFAGPADVISAIEDYRELLVGALRALKSSHSQREEA